MRKKIFLKLFQCCFITRGIRRSIIIDTQRNDFHFIPNELYDILTKKTGYSIESILDEYDAADKSTIEEYLSFLIVNELAFYTDEPDNFPDISTEFHEPRLISNGIIDLNENSDYNLPEAIDQLDLLGAEAIQIRIFNAVCLDDLLKILSLLNATKRLRTVELLTKYNKDYGLSEIQQMISYCPLLSRITIHSAEKSEWVTEIKTCAVLFVKQEINTSTHCGYISPEYFSCDISHVTESFKYNTCLNKKISIDHLGNIKHCPTMLLSYGNVRDNKLSKIISNTEFTSVWNLSKNKIHICNVCEFRNICTDCRAVTQNNDLYGKPKNCKYDPYNAKWA